LAVIIVGNILVFIEVVNNVASPASLCVLNAGRRIASELGATLCALVPCVALPSYGNDDIIAIASRHGADKVILTTDPTLNTPALFATHGQAVLAACERVRPRLLLFPATAAGQDIAPRIACALRAAFYANAELSTAGGPLQFVSPVFRRRFQLTAPFTDARGLTVLTLTPQAFAPPRAMSEEDAEVILVHLPDNLPPCPLTIGERRAAPADALSTARVVVGTGGGVTTPEDFARAKQLAVHLRGAFGSSQTTVNAGQAELEHLLGLSGNVLAAELYLAFGISGSDRHLAGIDALTHIVAINSDPQAPIFHLAQYGIVADAHQALQELLDQQGPETP
jgi:electron transfer flavoprotein alpha subunit